MSHRDYGNVPHDNDHDSIRFEDDRYHEGLFGGPAADLYGTSGMVSNKFDYAEESSGPRHTENFPFDNPVGAVGSLVRPYTRTGGRTKPDYDLAVEALVLTSERGRDYAAVQLPEHRSICGLCVDARSVAEVAAYLRLPLGVIRILIGDMASMGLVLIHQGGLVADNRSPLDFLERVLSGLRRL